MTKLLPSIPFRTYNYSQIIETLHLFNPHPLYPNPHIQYPPIISHSHHLTLISINSYLFFLHILSNDVTNLCSDSSVPPSTQYHPHTIAYLLSIELLPSHSADLTPLPYIPFYLPSLYYPYIH